jgi:hypothetical protein
MKRFAFVTLLALALPACKKSEAELGAERFLTALSTKRYEAAHAMLHTEAKALVPTPTALQTLVESRGVTVTKWSQNCSSGGPSGALLGYNFSSTSTGGPKTERVTIGVEPRVGERCRVGPLFVEAVPEAGVWRVRSCKY